ncbi:hypothetical protein J2Y48_004030 [Mycoplana sp. BE70]|nr:hypothetical protein [Mycoplana sp. BE70]
MIASQHPETMQVPAIGPEFGTSADGFPVARMASRLQHFRLMLPGTAYVGRAS